MRSHRISYFESTLSFLSHLQMKFLSTAVSLFASFLRVDRSWPIIAITFQGSKNRRKALSLLLSHCAFHALLRSIQIGRKFFRCIHLNVFSLLRLPFPLLTSTERLEKKGHLTFFYCLLGKWSILSFCLLV